MQIAGVALNGVSERGDVEKSLEEIKTVNNVGFQQIFGLLNNVNKELDLFSKYDIEQIYEFRILAVDSRFRGRGVAKELYARSEKIAIENGFKVSLSNHFLVEQPQKYRYKFENCFEVLKYFYFYVENVYKKCPGLFLVWNCEPR